MSGRRTDALDRLRRLSDDELAAELTTLGRTVAWPATSDMSGRVAARIAAPATQRGFLTGVWPALRRPALRRAAILALAALIVVAGVATALGLGVPGIRILFGPTPTPGPSLQASAPASASGEPSPAGLGAALALGRRVSLAEAQAACDFPIVQPTLAGLDEPEEIWVDGAGSTVAVSLVWGATSRPAAPGTEVGLLIMEFRGSIDRPFLEKIVASGTSVEHVTVGGSAGYWLSGAPHEVVTRLPSGDYRSDRVRLAGNVLMWTRGPLTLRLETVAGRDDAIRIAESLR